jgi:hypothetical protein
MSIKKDTFKDKYILDLDNKEILSSNISIFSL